MEISVRKISDNLLSDNVRHYSIRYTEVMAVISDYVLTEDPKYRDHKTRVWKETSK